MKIEVTWKAIPSSGITEIDLKDLRISSKKEWESLSDSEKHKKINDYIEETDIIKPKVTDWNY